MRAVVAALAVLALAAPVARADPIVFGVNADRVFNDDPALPNRGALLRGLAETVPTARTDAFWALSEP